MVNRFQFQFSPNAEHEFADLDPPIQQRILSKLRYFEMQPNPLHFSKKLHGPKNEFRFRIGDYRVIVTPREGKILIILVILKIAHRRDVYEN